MYKFKKTLILICLVFISTLTVFIVKKDDTSFDKDTALIKMKCLIKITPTKKNSCEINAFLKKVSKNKVNKSKIASILRMYNKVNFENKDGVGLEGITLTLAEKIISNMKCDPTGGDEGGCLDEKMNFIDELIAIPMFSEYKQDFIMQSQAIKKIKQISMPGADARFYFNPSIIKYKDHYLVSFRSNRNLLKLSDLEATEVNHSKKIYKEVRNEDYATNIYIAELDKNFDLIGEQQNISQFIPTCGAEFCTAEDSRIIEYNGDVYIFYNTPEIFVETTAVRTYQVARIIKENNKFTLKDHKQITLPFYGDNFAKNWMPIVHQGKMLLVYLIEPRTIVLDLNLDNGLTKIYSNKKFTSDFKFGAIRGGTPYAQLTDNKYLSFFHTRLKFEYGSSKYSRYYMSSLILDCSDHCEVDKIAYTPILPFFAQYDGLKKGFASIFPTGLIVNDDEIIVSFGKSDEQSYIVVLDKEKYLSTLKVVDAKDYSAK